jgi:hypothetical protein
MRQRSRRVATARKTALTLALTAFVAATGSAAARAGRLPLAGGGWIEVRGDVRVERGRVVFLSAEGNLRSLPLAELASLAPRSPDGPPLREYPSDAAIVLPPPPDAPRRPLPRRPGSREIPPRCWLVNARPGDPPELLCGDSEATGPPPVAPAERAVRSEPAAQGAEPSPGP